jgi:thymidylate synthase (FAD)
MSSPINQAKSAELMGVINTTGDVDVKHQAEKQLSEMTAQLILDCVEQGHFSVLEQASMAVFIKTTRAIAPQLLRHDANFQEFSQRYTTVKEALEVPEVRMVNGRLRDRSVSPAGANGETLAAQMQASITYAEVTYNDLLSKGVHPESARMVLPLCTPTYLHMATNMRTWFFYLKNRMSSHAQAEHNQIARCIYSIMSEQYPTVTQAFNLSLKHTPLT